MITAIAPRPIRPMAVTITNMRRLSQPHGTRKSWGTSGSAMRRWATATNGGVRGTRTKFGTGGVLAVVSAEADAVVSAGRSAEEGSGEAGGGEGLSSKFING